MSIGANVPPLTLSGEPWRLVTAIFLHGSIPHIASNTVALLLLGGLLELYIARWKWLLIFVIGGLASSYASACLNFDYVQYNILLGPVQTLYVAVGASGAIMALGGAAIALGIYRSIEADEGFDQLLRVGLAFVALNLIYSLTTDGVDNTAHVSGLIFGVLCGGGLLVPATLISPKLRTSAVVISAAMIAIGLNMLHAGLPSKARQAELIAEIRGDMAAEAAAERLTQAKQTEAEEQLHYVDEARATGTLIKIPGIARIAPGATDNIVYLAANGDSARLLKYDLDRGKVVRTVIDVPYPADTMWACKTKMCAGIGISDVVINADATVAYVTSLYPGKVSRIDLSSGTVDYSVETGSFPNQLLLGNDRLYAYDRVDNTLSIIGADGGRLIKKIDIPSHRNAVNSIGGYKWVGGKDMALSRDGTALYLMAPDGGVVRVDLTHMKAKRLDMRYPVGVATGAAGHIWLVTRNGAHKADMSSDISYDYGFHYGPGDGLFVNADGKHPLVLVWYGGYASNGRIIGLSPLTGRVRRSWRSNAGRSDKYSWHTVEALGDKRFVVRGWRKAEIFAIRDSMKPDPRDQSHADRIRIGGR